MARIGLKVCRTWFLFLLFLSFHSLVSSALCKVPKQLRRRMEAVSPGDLNEIGAAVNEDSTMKAALKTILDEFKDIDVLRPKIDCMDGMNDTSQRVGQIVQNLGFPRFDSCMSRIDYEYQKAEEEQTKKLSTALDKFESGLAAKGANAIKSINPSIIDDRQGFGTPVEVGDIPWTKQNNYYVCSIHHANAYRVNGSWNYIAELTNVASTEEVGARERYFYREMFQLSPTNSIMVQPVTIPRCVNKTTIPETGNAWVEVWGGTTNASVYMEGDIDSNPALLSVLENLQGKEEDGMYPIPFFYTRM